MSLCVVLLKKKSGRGVQAESTIHQIDPWRSSSSLVRGWIAVGLGVEESPGVDAIPCDMMRRRRPWALPPPLCNCGRRRGRTRQYDERSTSAPIKLFFLKPSNSILLLPSFSHWYLLTCLFPSLYSFTTVNTLQMNNLRQIIKGTNRNYTFQWSLFPKTPIQQPKKKSGTEIYRAFRLWRNHCIVHSTPPVLHCSSFKV